jgi:hypothetical protein
MLFSPGDTDVAELRLPHQFSHMLIWEFNIWNYEKWGILTFLAFGAISDKGSA